MIIISIRILSLKLNYYLRCTETTQQVTFCGQSIFFVRDINVKRVSTKIYDCDYVQKSDASQYFARHTTEFHSGVKARGSGGSMNWAPSDL